MASTSRRQRRERRFRRYLSAGRLVRAQNAIPDTEGVRRTGRVEARCVRGSEEGGVQQAQAPGEARQGGRQRQPGRQEAG